MALTKITRAILDTGISDSSDATAITIDSNENVGIGTTSPAEKLEVNGNIKFGDGHTIGNGGGDNLHLESSTSENIVFNAAGGFTVFQGGGTEYARFDDSGNFIVGKTSSVAAGAGIYLSPSGASFYTVNNTGAANTLHVYDNVDSAYRFYVRATATQAGTIFATNEDISGISDERLKENIKDLETGLTEIMALKPRRFDWKEGEGDGTKNNAGFIAQEVETVFPELVDNYLHDELDDAKSLRKGGILPTLVKAIQEQQEIINNLKTRIEALEA